MDMEGDGVISAHLKPGRPRVLAVFSFRYDAHLIPALVANIHPFVDGWVAYDDRRATGVFSNEVQRRVLLLNAARDAGAAWALAVDPDERFEFALADKMPALLEQDNVRAHSFAVRELYSPHHYRIDGAWGLKNQARLLSLRDGVLTPPGDLHLSWASFIPNADPSFTGINLYHLKMITVERRKARAALYNHLDPGRVMQSIGYDYLADDTGAELRAIETERAYYPPHCEDGGLWMAKVAPEC
jgi:hypothetical protein